MSEFIHDLTDRLKMSFSAWILIQNVMGEVYQETS